MNITMKRGIITNNGQGIHISDGEVWMTGLGDCRLVLYNSWSNQLPHKSDIESQYFKGV